MDNKGEYYASSQRPFYGQEEATTARHNVGAC